MALLLAEKIDWALAGQMFSTPDRPSALEADKIPGVVLLWLLAYVCGKKKLAEPQQETLA